MDCSAELLPGCKYAQTKLGRVLVLGLGKSARAALDYLVPLLGGRVSHLAVAAGASAGASDETLAYARGLRECGVSVEFDHETIEGSYDVCIASPGISQFSSFYKSAELACGEVISEVEFAWRESAADSVWVAVTGTNGKTTTTSLVAHLLQGAGMCANAVGNIGDTCIDAVAAGKTSVYVVEASSYQLASVRRFAPNVAVLLNITPDHLSWHKSHEAYVAAKLKIFDNLPQVPGSVAVLDATCDTVRRTVRAFRAQEPSELGFSYVPVGTAAGLGESMIEACGSQNAAYVRDGRLHVNMNGEDHDAGEVSSLLIKGPHNVSNALVAAVCAVALGVPDELVRAGLATFAPLEHRIEPCGLIGGVSCYNDSKATNVDATLVALSSFEPGSIVALLGGRDKGTDLSPLVKRARQTCKAVVLFGESRDRFEKAFAEKPSSGDSAELGKGGNAAEGAAVACASAPDGKEAAGEVGAAGEKGAAGLQILLADHLKDALDVALSASCAGDEIVLSPACASFDEFSCFEERGRVFKDLVAARACADSGNRALS